MDKKTKKKNYWYVYLIVYLLIMILAYCMTYMPGKSYSGESPKISDLQKELAVKYKNQLELFATEPRNVTHMKGLKNTEQFLINELKLLNVEVNEQNYGDFKNIEAVIPSKEKSLKTLVIGAHYDTSYDSIGADDNASSVVILLELVKRFKEFNSKDTTLKLVFFTNEEPPYFKTKMMGSMVYAKELHEKKENVIAMYAFDCLGYFKDEKGSQNYPIMFAPFYGNKGDFVGFVGGLNSRDLVIKTLTSFRKNAKFPSEGVAAFDKIAGISWSDHSSFNYYGWPALMVTDTAFNRNHHYHKTTDTIDKLNLEKMAQLTDELETMFRDLYEDK